MIICDKCGKENEQSNKFCTNCGAKLRFFTKETSVNTTYYGKNRLTYEEFLNMRKNKGEKWSKTSYRLANISFVLAIVAITMGIPLMYYIVFSLERRVVFNIIFTTVLGILLIAFSITSFVLGQVSRKLRKDAIYYKVVNNYTKKGGLISVFGIILSIIGLILSMTLTITPFVVIRGLNSS